MKKKIIVSYIKSPSKWGEILFEQTKNLLENFALEQQSADMGTPFEIEITDPVNQMLNGDKSASLADCQWYSFNACFYSDIVIFDGSIEEGRYDQYQFAYDLMKSLDHVLIISRTELPYNFEGRRKGGAPSWIKISEKLIELDTMTDPTQANAYILEWLAHTLRQMELPRSNKLTKPLTLFSNMMDIIPNLMDKSDERMKEFEKSTLFISYLSKDYETLKNHFHKIEEHTGLTKEKFHYFAPGKVATEFMTEQRRWEIVSITDREINKCSSILIFETEGYYHSWWTMGELISISFNFRECWEDCPLVYVAKVYPNNRGSYEFTWSVLNTPEQKKEFFPSINERQMRRLARRFINSDPYEAAYELDEKMNRQSKQGDILKFLRAILNGTGLFFLNKGGVLIDSLGDTTLLKLISWALESENSYTRTEAFRAKRIVECKYCRESASNLTIDNFIQLDMPYVYHVDDGELTEYDDGTLIPSQKCPIHGSIRLKKNGHYYRFIQPRRGKLMGAKKTLIEYIDKIEFSDI